MVKHVVRIFVLMAPLLVTGCVELTIAWAGLTPDGPPATPPALVTNSARIITIRDWENERAPAIREGLQRHIYGFLPEDDAVEVISSRVLDKAAFSGKGVLSELKLKARAIYGGVSRDTREFYMDVVMPAGDLAAPIILIQTFCPRWDTIPHSAIYRPEGAKSCSDGAGSGLMKYVFGRYIATPPIEKIISAGYGVATIFPSEFVDDDAEAGLAMLSDLSAGLDENKSRWGAIAAWAWGYSLMVDALEQEGSIQSSDYISMGHSRYGKSALLAAAFDARITGVIAHQSGTGGASLNRGKKGESIKSITENYPHWFTPAFANFEENENADGIDQHLLLGLIAPRPVLLGNARRDVWSDPNGAFRAAMGADPVYEHYGVSGLDQERLDVWKPSSELAFWLRPGTHGVVAEDWPAFLEFLDFHFGD